MIKGSIVAIVTPMHADGSLDKAALLRLVDWHLQAKTDALVVVGTTGESATLDADEQTVIIKCVVEHVNHRIPVIAGTGSNATDHALVLTKAAKAAGADAALIVTPYYNKPTQKGLITHYTYLAENAAFPIILYNVPGRTGCDMQPETVIALSKVRHIIGVKEASGKPERIAALRAACGKDFAIYSGDDGIGLAAIQSGADGIISVTANIAPEKMHEMCQAALAGNHARAKILNDELHLLHERLFLESNPIPTKWALHTMGKIEDGIRLPLLSLDRQHHHAVKEAMEKAGVSLT
jgi:4-hydroxy-tetrahydrodipicolinate synthase